MGLPTEVLRALIDMGATTDMLLAASVAAEERQRADAAAARAEAIAQDEERRERRREGNRVRQARFRDRRNANNADNAVTRRDERDPSPNEINLTPTHEGSPEDPNGSSPPKGAKRPKASRGEFLPQDWQPSSEDWAFAVAELGSEPVVQRTLLKFRNYWFGKTGAPGRKRDWSATWRNWVMKEAESVPTASRTPRGPSSFGGRQGSLLDAVSAGVAGAAARRGIGPGAGPRDLRPEDRRASADRADDPRIVDADWSPTASDRYAHRRA